MNGCSKANSVFSPLKKSIFFFKISSLVAELEALKKEKGETDQARKRAEEQIEALRKEHEEKVISLSSFCTPQEYVIKSLLKVAL